MSRATAPVPAARLLTAASEARIDRMCDTCQGAKTGRVFRGMVGAPTPARVASPTSPSTLGRPQPPERCRF
jgi:hypothetical protein